jgi:hypothetical protein
VTDEVISNTPQAFKEFVSNSLLAATTNQIPGSRFSFPFPTPRIPPGVTVDEFRIRSVFRYQLKDSSYVIEVAIYRGWDNGNFKSPASTQCGINFYHKDWDLFMTPDVKVTEVREWEFESFFPLESGSGDGFSNFLAKVKIVQDFFSK